MLIRKPGQIPFSDITDEQVYLRRREFLPAGRSRSRPRLARAAVPPRTAAQTTAHPRQAEVVATDEKLNTFEEITSYNNFYEFGTGKNDPAVRGSAEDGRGR